MGFMHLYMKYTQPLFIQSILPVKGLYDSKVTINPTPLGLHYVGHQPPRPDPSRSTLRLVPSHLTPRSLTSTNSPLVNPRPQILKIHLLGQPATGDLQRPFAAAPSPFAAFMPDTTAAAAPEAVEAKPLETKKAK